MTGIDPAPDRRLRRVRLPSYAEIARSLGVARCRGLDQHGRRCLAGDHSKGLVTIEDGRWLVHWADRRPSYPGFYRFLRLVGSTQPEVIQSTLPWYARYLILRAVIRLATRARIRIPREAMAEDEASLLRVVRAQRPSTTRRAVIRWLNR